MLPAGVAAAIGVASFTTSVASNAAAEPNLPTRTAAQLLADLEQARPAGLSGTIVETTKLGLPSLPDIGGSGSDSDLSLTNLLTGAHTLRVWYAGQENQRIALLGQLSETDVIHHGTDVWTYSSTTRAVTHSTIKAGAHASDATTLTGGKVAGLTPQQAAEDALQAIDPTTAVEVDSTARVAGRSTYQLVLKPKDTRSLIGSVRIAIDSKTSVPLRVQVFAKDATSPAIQVGFTDVSFNVPDSSVFEFVPPAGSTVTQGSPFDLNGATQQVGPKIKAGVAKSPAEAAHGSESTKLLGKGWTAIVQVKNGMGTASSGANGPPSMSILNDVATPVKGGRLITSTIMSVFIADDGTIYAGPVSPAAIEQVAATGQGL
jgi:outer membrane lipoprotein-sorting protein